MNKIIMDAMLWQCVYKGTAGACPVWLWVVVGLLVLGFVGFLVWLFKNF